MPPDLCVTLGTLPRVRGPPFAKNDRFLYGKSKKSTHGHTNEKPFGPTFFYLPYSQSRVAEIIPTAAPHHSAHYSAHHSASPTEASATALHHSASPTGASATALHHSTHYSAHHSAPPTGASATAPRYSSYHSALQHPLQRSTQQTVSAAGPG
jgi:hypothetical protein